METNRILSSSLLDLVFDNRNKEYGAYDLRATYPVRIKKALIATLCFIFLAVAGMLLASAVKPSVKGKITIAEHDLINIKQDEVQPPPPPPPPKQIPPVVQMTQFTPPRIVRDEDVQQPPPIQEDLKDVKIDIANRDGIKDDNIMTPQEIDGNKNIIEPSKTNSDEPFRAVEIPARFEGDWSKFLLRNLRPNVPVDNGAAVGRYKVSVEFVVDVDGSVSNIKPITTNGFGMEEEAVRVLKKAEKWKPGIQNGIAVKAYHTQTIIFEVSENE